MLNSIVLSNIEIYFYCRRCSPIVIKKNLIKYSFHISTSFGTHRYFIYRDAKASKYTSKDELLNEFKLYLISLIEYLDNINNLSPEVKTKYKMKYNSFNKIFNNISIYTIYNEFKQKFL